VTLLHPRTEPAPADTKDVEAEALIREARRLRRRRWSIGFVVVAVAGAGIGWAVTAGSPSRPAPVRPVPRHHVSTSAAFSPGLPVGPYAHLKVAGPLAVAPTGALYVADVDHEQVLVRFPDGRFRVIAGNGKRGVLGDGGPAVDAEFLDIQDMAVGSDGSLYVVDGDRVRVVSPNGVISTVAGIPGQPNLPPQGPSTLPPPIVNGTPARTVSINQWYTAAIALSEQGVLYISTGLQLLRLDAGALDVIVTRTTGPYSNGQPLSSLGNLGQIAVDAQGNIYVSGGGGWGIWRVAPDGTATDADNRVQEEARRSGGDTSVLERSPDGVVYGESGGRFLKLQGDRATLGYAFPTTKRSYFWLTYFAFGSDGTVYADEIPGSGGFERYQQLRVVRGTQTSVLWHQTSADVARVPS
jgi:sugar lactone lactonase YvrE